METDRGTRLQLALAEYQSLRDESAQARQAQQTILSWSLGAVVVVVAAALATADKSSNGIELVRLGVAGFVLPGLIFGAALAWVGEMIRMERTGFYLRGRERRLWAASSDKQFEREWIEQVESHPTIWENFIAFGGASLGQKKQPHGYIGALIIYCGSLAVSLFVFGWLLHNHSFHTDDALLTWAGYVWGGLSLLLGWGVLLHASIRLEQLSKKAAGFDQLRK